MTSIPVSNAKSAIADFAVKAPAKNQTAGGADSFTDVLNKQTDGNSPGQKVGAAKNGQEKDTKAATRIAKSANDRIRQEKTGKTSKTVTEEMDQAVQKAGQELVQKIAEELNLSEEDVLQAMEVLGLSMADILQPENLNLLVMQAVGENDPLAALTNEDLAAALKNLNQFVCQVREELQSVYNLSEEALNQAIDLQKENRGTVASSLTEMPGEENASNTPEIVVETVEGEPVKEVPGRDIAGESSDTDAAAQDVQQMQDVLQPEKMQKQEKDDGSATQQNHPSDTPNLFLQNLTQNAENIQTDAPEAMAAAGQTREIMDQIMEYMRVQIKPEMTQLEMQLHPESLGNVHVHISSREGVITAQFTAQNETVKAALESQIVQLKETFNEQGVKVEQIEVHVQANGFQQEYEGSREQQRATEESSKKTARRINLNLLSGMDEQDLSEDEQVLVSMMEADGNTVDFKA